MAALPMSTIRSRIATALEAVTGWTEAKSAYELYSRDSDSLVHLGFAVGILSTTVEPQGQRHRGVVRCESRVAVRFAHRLRGDAQIPDYGAALDAELVAIAAVLSVSLADLHVTFESSDRAANEAGFTLCTLNFRAVHQVALT